MICKRLACCLCLFPSLFLVVFLNSCGRQEGGAYTPGLGEIMTLIQMRHSKLYFAGLAKNWPLASYEVKELQEGFADVVHFHPTHQGSPVPLAALCSKLIQVPLDQLQSATQGRDLAKFKRAFQALTSSCNACHEATHFAFNRVRIPQSNPFSNQSFGLPK